MGFKLTKIVESGDLSPLATCDNIEGSIHYFEFWVEARPTAMMVFVPPAAGQIACDEACAHEILCGPGCSNDLTTCSANKGAVIVAFDDYLAALSRRVHKIVPK